MKEQKDLVLQCARAIPPTVVLPSLDIVQELSDSAALRIVSGYQTEIELDALAMLLRDGRYVKIIPARTFEPGQWLYGGKLWTSIKQGMARGNVTIVSPPGVVGSRVTKANAEIRNKYLLSLGHPVLVLSAPPESKTAALAHEALEMGLPVFTLPHKSHQPLFDAGAQEATIDAILKATNK